MKRSQREKGGEKMRRVSKRVTSEVKNETRKKMEWDT